MCQNGNANHTIVNVGLMETHSNKHMLKLKEWITNRLLCALGCSAQEKTAVSIQAESYSVVALMEH